MYKDIACSTQLLPNSTRKEYIAYSTGVADYITPSGTNVSIERRVFTSMRAQGFEEYMYFTHEEYPIGPGNTGTVNFGPNDNLEGKVHTNGVMTMSNWGCPDFSGEVNVTFEAIEENGNAINYGSCDEGDLTFSTKISTVTLSGSRMCFVAFWTSPVPFCGLRTEKSTEFLTCVFRIIIWPKIL